MDICISMCVQQRLTIFSKVNVEKVGFIIIFLHFFKVNASRFTIMSIHNNVTSFKFGVVLKKQNT